MASLYVCLCNVAVGCGHVLDRVHVSCLKGQLWFMMPYNIGTNYTHEEDSLLRLESYVVISKSPKPHGASVCSSVCKVVMMIALTS